MIEKNVLCRKKGIMARGRVVVILPRSYGYCIDSSGVSCIDRWIKEVEKIIGEVLAWSFYGCDERVVVKTLGNQVKAQIAMNRCGEQHIELVSFLMSQAKKKN